MEIKLDGLTFEFEAARRDILKLAEKIWRENTGTGLLLRAIYSKFVPRRASWASVPVPCLPPIKPKMNKNSSPPPSLNETKKCTDTIDNRYTIMVRRRHLLLPAIGHCNVHVLAVAVVVVLWFHSSEPLSFVAPVHLRRRHVRAYNAFDGTMQQSRSLFSQSCSESEAFHRNRLPTTAFTHDTIQSSSSSRLTLWSSILTPSGSATTDTKSDVSTSIPSLSSSIKKIFRLSINVEKAMYLLEQSENAAIRQSGDFSSLTASYLSPDIYTYLLTALAATTGTDKRDITMTQRMPMILHLFGRLKKSSPYAVPPRESPIMLSFWRGPKPTRNNRVNTANYF